MEDCIFDSRDKYVKKGLPEIIENHFPLKKQPWNVDDTKSKASRGQTGIRVNRMVVCSTVCSSSSQRWNAVHLVFELDSMK